jgi:tetratricopeptide (TPR) repeat protein
MRQTAKLGAFLLLVTASAGNTHVLAQNGVEVPRDIDSAERDYSSYIASLRSARDNLLRARDFSAALSLAELIVSEQRMEEAEDIAADLVMHALVLAELGQYDVAETEFLEAIDLIVEDEGEFSTALIPPLQLLGRAYTRARLFPEAITAFEQARHISQRNAGLFNVEQAELFDDLTTAYLGTGDTRTARSLQIERLVTAQRRFGEGDPRVIPFHNHLADYLERSRLRLSARDEYEAVLGILEESRLPNDPALLPPLRDIARLNMALGEGTDVRDRLVEILETNEEQLDPLERGLTLAVLGDWATVDEEFEVAEDYYSQAYALIDAAESLDAPAYFDTPVMLDFAPPLSDVDRGYRSLPYSWGLIVIDFSVTSRGRIDEVRSYGIEPRHKIENDYLDRLNDAHFRPQIVDGTPVATEGLRFSHNFRFYVEEDAEEEDDEDQDDQD